MFLPSKGNCIMTLTRCALFGLLSAALLVAQSQPPNPHDVPIMDGQAGPCSVSFTVTDTNGAPIYDAKINVHIEYGFAGVRRLDLQASTNIDGKAQFKGLPKRVKGELLYFNATKDKLAGSATYDPDKSCGGENDSIVLAQHKSSAAILSGSEESMHLHPSRH
jgi:hypothetical protein